MCSLCPGRLERIVQNGFIENNIIILIRYCHRNIFEAEGKVFDHPRTVSLSPLLTCYRLDLSSLL